MSGKRYTEVFKIEAVKQITERGHAATKVATRLGINSHSLYRWASNGWAILQAWVHMQV